MKIKNTYNTGNTTKITVQLNGVPVAIITITNAINEVTKFTKHEHTLDTGKRYFGTYTFLINAAFPKIALIAIVLASLKKVKYKLATH